MADHDSDVALLQSDPTAQNMVIPPQLGGTEASLECIYTAKGTEVNGDRIRLFIQPENYRANAPDFQATTNGIGGTSAIGDVGDDADPQAIASGLDVTNAGMSRANASGNEAVTPFTTEIERWLYFTFTTLDALPTLGQKIVFRLTAAKT